MIEFFTTFPEMSKAGLRLFKKTVDGAYRNFSREYGDTIESIFDPNSRKTKKSRLEIEVQKKIRKIQRKSRKSIPRSEENWVKSP